MADFTQASVADAISHQEVSHANSVYGSSITPTTGALWAVIHMHHALIEVGDNANPQSFYVQTNLGTTNESWTTVAQFTATDDSTIVTEAMTATEASGEVSLAVASTTDFLANDYIYIQDTTTPANSEWHQIDKITGTPSIDITAGLVTGKDNADIIWSHAETFTMTLDLSGVARWRVIYKSEGAAAMNSAIWVRYIEVTDIE